MKSVGIKRCTANTALAPTVIFEGIDILTKHSLQAEFRV